jgi:hypothetical protein
MPVTFPAQLTKPNLVKNKKLIAGMGSATLERDINALERDFVGSHAMHVDVAAMGKETLDPVKFEAMRDNFKKVHDSQRKKLEGAAQQVEADLKGIRTALAANKKTDKKVLAYADALLKAAHSLAFSLKPVATGEAVYLLEKAYSAHLKASQNYLMVEQVIQTGAARHAKLLEDIQAVRSAGTVDVLHQTWRSGSSSARLFYIDMTSGWDQAILPAFPGLAHKSKITGKANDTLVKRLWIADVANEAQGKASDKVRALIKGPISEDDAVNAMLDQYASSVNEMYKVFGEIQAVWAELGKWK